MTNQPANTIIFALVTVTACSGLLAFVFYYIHGRDRERFMRLWALSWVFYTLRYACVLLSLLRPEFHVLGIAAELLALTGGLLLLIGTFAFLGRKTPTPWIYCFALVATWTLGCGILKVPFTWFTLPAFVFQAAAHLWTGLAFLSVRRGRGAGARIAGISFIVWGLHKANYPFLRQVVWFAPWGFLLAAALELLISMGMLIEYFQRINDKLKASRNDLNSLVEKNPAGIFRTSPGADGIITAANSAFAGMFGYHQAELIGRQAADLYADPAERAEISEEILRGGELSDRRIRLRRRSDEVFWASVSLSLARDPSDGSKCFQGIIRDVTEQVRIMDALKLNESRLEALLELNQKTFADTKEITDFTLEEAVRLTGSRIGFLAFLNDDEIVMELNSWSKTVMDECKMPERNFSLNVAALGLLGEAVRGRRPVITNDYSAPNSLKNGCPEGHVRVDRCLNVPILDGERVVLTACVGNKETDYDQSDVRQVTLLMQGMWRMLKRREEERTLVDSEARLRSIIDASPLGIHMYTLEEDGRLVFSGSNLAGDRILGIRHDELLGKTIEEAFPNLAGTEVPDAYRKAATHGVPWYTESIFYKDKMIAGAFEVYAFQTTWRNVTVMFHDVTARMQTDAALKRERDLLSAIADTSPVAIAVIDARDGRFTYANRYAERLAGMSKNELIEIAFSDSRWEITDVDGGPFPAGNLPITKVIATGEPAFGVKMGINLPTGVSIIASVSASPMFDETGAVASILVILEEITERHRAELKVLEERDKAQSYLDIAGVLIVALDAGGNVMLLNRSGCETLNFRNEEAVGLNWFDNFLPERFREETKEVFSKLMAGEVDPFEFYENPVLTRAGEERLVAWHNNLLYDESGRIAGTLSSGEDITERKKTEEELQRYRERLEDLVEERTRELRETQEKLIASERLAVLGQFAGGIAHEIRNPLAVISNAAYFLNRLAPKDDVKFASNIEKIQRQVARAAEIIESILRLTRLQPPLKQPVDAAEMMREAVGAAKPPRGVAVEFHEGGSVLIPADREQLRIAFDNVVKNAVQAMGNSGTLRVEFNTPGNETVEIIVSDTGPGVSPENLEKIFTPLFTTKSFGIGFGLSITKMIVEKHDGAIRVESPAGRGTRFTITLPAPEDAERE